MAVNAAIFSETPAELAQFGRNNTASAAPDSARPTDHHPILRGYDAGRDAISIESRQAALSTKPLTPAHATRHKLRRLPSMLGLLLILWRLPQFSANNLLVSGLVSRKLRRMRLMAS